MNRSEFSAMARPWVDDPDLSLPPGVTRHPTIDEWQEAIDLCHAMDKSTASTSQWSDDQNTGSHRIGDLSSIKIRIKVHGWSDKIAVVAGSTGIRYSLQLRSDNGPWVEFASSNDLDQLTEKGKMYMKHQKGRRIRIVDLQENIEITHWWM